ncbi:MAG: hypothetical protein IJX82_03730 [Clostridia bacterium]|nr:hypothetical protein [Clostridia bacterium]
MNEFLLQVDCCPSLSAIYYALLQCGYEYHLPERDAAHGEALERFRGGDVPAFFRGVKQNTCEVYPYWPRAALLESALFYLTPDHREWADFSAFRARVMNAPNLTPEERNDDLWQWIREFPSALQEVFASPAFREYLTWESTWLETQKALHAHSLNALGDLLAGCNTRYGGKVKRVQLWLNPIKCVYSADYHIHGDTLFYCSGTLKAESILHEFLHPIIHPLMEEREDLPADPALDPSYTADPRYAAEETAVRRLTSAILKGEFPEDLPSFLSSP